jgi:hypothetical protein
MHVAWVMCDLRYSGAVVGGGWVFFAASESADQGGRTQGGQTRWDDVRRRTGSCSCSGCGSGLGERGEGVRESRGGERRRAGGQESSRAGKCADVVRV